ncbi:hypothetical protein [Dinoroseobacter sp. S76]|uniref:hypothetical protein n=1 Tax=Dinoroseobacter sp. S76 TaxID=3415124 RepID=UPI003C7C8B69
MAQKKVEDTGAKLGSQHPLYDVVAEAYRVFKYPRPHSLEVCQACCMDPAIEAEFLEIAIEDLPLRALSDWFSAACDPGGVSKSVWGYLLPRILEALACGEEVSSVGLEVSLSRFQTGQKENWSETEWRVLDDFRKRYLRHAMRRYDHHVDDMVCMFVLAGWPIDEILAQIASLPTAVLVERFWNDWCKDRGPGGGEVWITAFWEPQQTSRLHAFYTSKSFYQRFKQLAFAGDTPPFLAMKARALLVVLEDSAFDPA